MNVAFPDTLLKKNKYCAISKWNKRCIGYYIVEMVCEQTIELFEEFLIACAFSNKYKY